MNTTRAALSTLQTVETIKPLNIKIKYMKDHRTPLLEKIVFYSLISYPKVKSFPLIHTSSTITADFSKFEIFAKDIMGTPDNATDIWLHHSMNFSSIENHFYKQMIKGKSLSGIPISKLKTLYL